MLDAFYNVQVDIVIVNCSLFNPTPSLSAMVVNHFGMRPDIKSYNLSGMGCSAGIISIGLAKELLQASILDLLHPQGLTWQEISAALLAFLQWRAAICVLAGTFSPRKDVCLLTMYSWHFM